MPIDPTPLPQGSETDLNRESPPPIITDPTNPWLRKTDWCCDGIIANGQE
jgi:hypothetical protein